MNAPKTSVVEVKDLYRQQAKAGRFGTLAPDSGGKAKSRYVSEVFDAALIPRFKAYAASGTALDYGCGTGILTVHMAEHFETTYGVDISDAMLDLAKEVTADRTNCQFIQVDGLTLPFADRSFDCIVARESLCHVSDDAIQAVVSELSRVLAPGGHFLWLEQSSEVKKWRNHPGAPYVIKRSKEELFTLAERANLKVIEHVVVRKPRFFWIYGVRYGLVPPRLRKKLAAWEVSINRRIKNTQSRRWHDVLLVLQPK